VENKLHTALTGQSTHEDFVKESGLRRIMSFACGAFCFMKNLACGARFSKKIFFLIIRGCISFEVSYSVYQVISGENDLNSNTK